MGEIFLRRWQPRAHISQKDCKVILRWCLPLSDHGEVSDQIAKLTGDPKRAALGDRGLQPWRRGTAEADDWETCGG